MNVLLGEILVQHMEFVFFVLALGGHEYQLRQHHALLRRFHLHQYPYYGGDDDGGGYAHEPSLLMSGLLDGILNQHMEFIFFFLVVEEREYRLMQHHVLLHQFHLLQYL